MYTGSERVEPCADSLQPRDTTHRHASSGLPLPPTPPSPPASASASASPTAAAAVATAASRLPADKSHQFQPAAAPPPLHAISPSSSSSISTSPTPATTSVVAVPNPRSTSLPLKTAIVMGQPFAKPSKHHPSSPSSLPAAPPSSPSTAARGLNAAITGGIRLKRAFAGRRKKTTDPEPKLERAKSRDALLLSPPDPHQYPHGQGAGAVGGQFRQRIEATASAGSSSASSPPQVMNSPIITHQRGAKQLTQLASQVFNKRAQHKGAAVPPALTPAPSMASVSGAGVDRHHHQGMGPPVPPKADPNAHARLGARPPPVIPSAADHRSSIIPLSPGIVSAVSFMKMGEEMRDKEKAIEREKEREREREREREQEKKKERERHVVSQQKELEREAAMQAIERLKEAEKANAAAEAASKAEMKDTWRKSDSTIGHHTIRPNAGAGPRTSRPVSMAESLQSNHTIVPVNKRLSALVTDVDFGMPEEEVDRGQGKVATATATTTTTITTTTTEDSAAITPTTTPIAAPVPAPHTSPYAHPYTHAHPYPRPPPTPPPTSQKRRSVSVNIIPHAPFLHAKLPPAPASASVTELKHPSHSISEGITPTPSLARTQATATGFIGPSSAHGVAQSTGHNIRGKLAAWSATTGSGGSPAPSSSGHSSHGHGQLYSHGNHGTNPYTTFPPPPEAYRAERRLPAIPPPQQQPSPTPSFRPTAISITNSLAPAAGLAKRAVEKLERVWGGLNSGSGASASANVHGHGNSGSASGTSGYSSSGSTNTGTGTAPSSYAHSHSHSHSHTHTHDFGHELARTVSSQSSTGGSGSVAHHHVHIERDKKGRLRRTPNAPSVSSSMLSGAASGSDADAFGAPSGPVLGKRLRGPLRPKHGVGGGGGGGGGVVFGRDLRAVVRETGVWVGKPKAWGGRWRNWDGDGEEGGEGEEDGGEEAWKARRASVRRGQLKALEERRLPALVVRCAQHLLIWGVQEEGLFRVSGRPSHVSKLRSEFDTGADFDMTECEPWDLDPHAVASVFKAFLRELPEPILTHALLPFFEAAMTQETTANNATEPSATPISPSRSRGPGLPSNPRNSGLSAPGMRKPPSLSTLAMPSLTGMRPPSKNLLNVFQNLIAQLPEENRDLIRTVTELIKATARESKETKMPLSNLMLVFCPSLNMNPPLLKVLCEGEGIWEAPVLDIRKEETPNPEVEVTKGGEEPEEDEFSDARDGTEVEVEVEDDVERESIASESVGRRSEDIPSSVEYHASAEDVLERSGVEARRDPVSTVYLDTESTFADDTSSVSQSVARGTGGHTRNGSLATSFRDDGSSYTSEDQENPVRHYRLHEHSQSPPLLTSSAESLDTPSMSSGHPSLSHLQLHPVVDEYEKKTQGASASASGPMIAEPFPSGLSPATSRRPVISNPIPITGQVHFPSTQIATTTTTTATTNSSETTRPPVSPTASEKRRSIPILSLPNFSPTRLSSSSDGPDSPRTPDSVRAKRLKKPSLHLLFSKRSASSLAPGARTASSPSPSRPVISAPYLQSPRSASDSSISTPRSAVTAPQSSTNTLPPTLDTQIESGSLGMGLGLGIGSGTGGEQAESGESPATLAPRGSKESSRPLPVPPPIIRQQFSGSSTSLVSHDMQNAPVATSHLRPYPARSRGLSTSSQASSNHLGMLDDEEPTEDWTRSVLMAADVSIVASSN